MKKTSLGCVSIRSVIRVVFATALAAVLMLSLFFLNACGSNKTEAARESLESTLAAIQAQDSKEISTYLTAAFFDSELYSVSSEAFAAVYFSDFTYEITSAKENSDGSVTATVVLASKNMTSILNLMMEALNAIHASSLAPTGSSSGGNPLSADAKFVELAQSTLLETHENTYAVTLTQEKNGDWQIADKGLFGALLLDGYDPRQLMD